MCDNIDTILDEVRIIVSAGAIFDGNVQQFRECFFSDTNPQSIVEWAIENGYSVMFVPNAFESKLKPRNS